MKTIITLSKVQRREIPERFRKNDNRFSETLVEHFLEEYTRKGDIVLDIFAGLGTTLFVAEDMERIPYGIEHDEQRCEYIRENLEHKENIINGDALKILEYNIPKCDFCLTSPPYMSKEDIENPFFAFSTQGNYEQYLLNYRMIYKQVKQLMKPDSVIVVEV